MVFNHGMADEANSNESKEFEFLVELDEKESIHGNKENFSEISNKQ